LPPGEEVGGKAALTRPSIGELRLVLAQVFQISSDRTPHVADGIVIDRLPLDQFQDIESPCPFALFARAARPA
jgi:hypothetical protein